MKIHKNKLIQFSGEALLIIGISYFAYQFFPWLPWWSVAVFAGMVAFLLNTNVKSFTTGFTAVALLWGFMATQLSGLNADLLAGKVAEMLSGNELIAQLGGLNPTRLIYLTAILGGIVGGLGAMTGSLGRKMWSVKKAEIEE